MDNSSLLTSHLVLPEATRVKRSLPKAQLLKLFDWTASQRERFDAEVSRLDFVNWISPHTVPAIAVGNEVKEIYVAEVALKSRNFDSKTIELLAKSIPQRIVYALRFENEVRFAVFHTKLFLTPWTQSVAPLPISGLNLDAVWENIVAALGNFVVAENNSLSEQIKINEERAKLLRRIETLERQMYATKQPRRKRELFLELQRLKGGLNG